MKKYPIFALIIIIACAVTGISPSLAGVSAIPLLAAADVGVSKATATLSSAEANGVGEVPYSWSVDKDETRKAEIKALQNAVESWVVNTQKAHYKNYKKAKGEIDKDINAYVLAYDVIDKDENKDSKTLRITLRAKINEVKMLDKLLSLSEEKSGESYITFVFVAREHAGSESYTEQSSSMTKGQSNTIQQQSDDNQSTIGKSQTQMIASSKTNKEFADQILWRVFTTNEIDVAMGDVFTNADFSVIDAGLLEEETGYLLEIKVSDHFRPSFQACTGT